MRKSQQIHDAYPLRTVARLTGLSADLIRAWEKRYDVVQPIRGPRGARLYTTSDVNRLWLLAQAVGGGRAIGDVAALPRQELQRLAGRPAPFNSHEGSQPPPPRTDDTLERALAAVRRFDMVGLDHNLSDALLALGTHRFIRQVATSLLDEVGTRWRDGRLSIANEHLVSGALRNLITALIRNRGQSADTTILLATPRGERHEFGVLLTALQVVDVGIGLCYLGADLPAGEVVRTVRRAEVKVVGIGVVNGENRRTAISEIRQLERGLPAETELWLGGRDAQAVAAKLGDTRALVVDHSDLLTTELERIHPSSATRR